MTSWALVLAAAGTALSLSMAAAWGVQRITGNSGWIDVTWTVSLGLVGAALSLGCGAGPRAILAAGFCAFWSLRLGVHLTLRTRATHDDPRYRALIDEWGPAAPRRLFWFAQAQAAVSLVLAGSVLTAARNPAPFPAVGDILAALIYACGIIGEAVADAQLRRFKADPANRGGICDRGLWRWSRHPNYFFEWMCWLSYPLLAIAPQADDAFGYAALAAPACMYWVLAHASGVPPLEAHLRRTKGEAFAAYCRRTARFFPSPPQHD